MKSCFLDTNILIYLLDPKNAAKQARAFEWLDALTEQASITISPQTILETFHVVRRKFRDQPRGEIENFAEIFRPWCTAPASFDVYMKGLALHFQTGYQIPDCTMLASALAARCEIFLTEDLSSGHVVEGMLVLNPFVTDCAAFLSANN